MMKDDNRVNLFNGKIITPIQISDKALERIVVALRELSPSAKPFDELMKELNNA